MNTPYWRKAVSAILCTALTLTIFPMTAFGAGEAPMEAASALTVMEEIVPLEAEEMIEASEPVDAVVDAAQAEEVTEEDVVAVEPVTEEEIPAEIPVTEEDVTENQEVPVEEEPVTETDEPVAEDGAPIFFSMSYTNPYCEDTDYVDLDFILDGASETVISGYCTTREEAAAVVREQMKARDTSFVFGYKTTDYPSTAYLEEILKEITEMAMVHTGNPTEGDYLLWQYKKYYAYADGYYKNGQYYLNFHYTFSYYTSASQEATLDTAVTSLLNELEVSGENDYAKISSIYDYICDNVQYDYTSTSVLKYTAYAALVNGKAVCQGYATLLYRLALELGIDCRIIAGTADGQEHRWNIALVNGAYYNLDSTWDAGESEYYCFLVSDENLVNHTRSSTYSSTTFLSSYPVSEEDFYLEDASPLDISWQNIIWNNTDSVLTVSGTGAIPDCDATNAAPWAGETYTSVKIEEGLTGVGANAFAGCTGLKEIYIMNDACAIYDSADTLGDPETTVIYCYYNSTAMAYAEKYNYDYVILGYSNCKIELEITTTVSAEEPVALIYKASDTDLIYEDIVLDEPVKGQEGIVSISEETLREDGLYSRTITWENVEPGKCDLGIYVPGGYVICVVDDLYFTDDINIGERHIWLYGDVDDNGTIDARDATQISRHANDQTSVFGSTTSSYTEAMRLKASDVNRDGFYSEPDAEQILYYITGQKSSLDTIP